MRCLPGMDLHGLLVELVAPRQGGARGVIHMLSRFLLRAVLYQVACTLEVFLAAQRILRSLAYAQTWHFMRHLSDGRQEQFQKLCGRIIGHEASRTELAWGGGPEEERHCRWCDFVIYVPRSGYQAMAEDFGCTVEELRTLDQSTAGQRGREGDSRDCL